MDRRKPSLAAQDGADPLFRGSSVDHDPAPGDVASVGLPPISLSRAPGCFRPTANALRQNERSGSGLAHRCREACGCV